MNTDTLKEAAKRVPGAVPAVRAIRKTRKRVKRSYRQTRERVKRRILGTSHPDCVFNEICAANAPIVVFGGTEGVQ